MSEHEQDVAPERVEAFIDAEAQHEAFVDADDTQQGDERSELDTLHLDLDAAKLGEVIAKAATDTAYATVGLVGVLSDRVKEYYEEQKKRYADQHPEMEEEPNATHLFSQFGEQLDRFVGDVGRTFQDLVERGRAEAKADDADEGEAADPGEATEADAVEDKTE